MKKFFPLWYVDIIKTENRLSKLSEKGVCLSDISPFLGVFSFENGDNQKVRYRICPSKSCGGEPPKGLAAGGWEKVCGGKNYYVVKNKDFDVQNVPSYSKWKTYNRISLYISFMLFCFIIGYFTGMMEELVVRELSDTHAEIIAFFLIFAASMFLMIRLFISNRHLAGTDSDLKLKGKVIKTIPEENFIYTRDEEKQMLKDGRMMKKLRPGWFYAPDKAEKTVEKLAEEGWRFYRFNPLGTVFYFIKSEPHKIKFVVDYQNEATDEYFLSAKDDGWKLEFTSMSRLQCFIIWSKEYDGEESPEIYSDCKSKLRYAKRMAYTFGILLALGALTMMLLSLTVIWWQLPENVPVGVFFLALYLTLVAELAVFAAKVIGFYIRTKRKYNNNK